MTIEIDEKNKMSEERIAELLKDKQDAIFEIGDKTKIIFCQTLIFKNPEGHQIDLIWNIMEQDGVRKLKGRFKLPLGSKTIFESKPGMCPSIDEAKREMGEAMATIIAEVKKVGFVMEKYVEKEFDKGDMDEFLKWANETGVFQIGIHENKK